MLTFSILSKSHLANSVISKRLICHDMFSLFLRFSKLNFEVGACSKLKQCAICCSTTEWRKKSDPGINISRRALTATFSFFISPAKGINLPSGILPSKSYWISFMNKCNHYFWWIFPLMWSTKYCWIINKSSEFSFFSIKGNFVPSSVDINMYTILSM